MTLPPIAMVALLAWIPIVLGLFMVLPPRRAAITAFVFGWLFLPIGGFSIQGLPDYTKVSATCVGVLLSAAIFDSGRLLALRPRWVDVPMALWVIAPFLASVTNGLGIYDAFSATVHSAIMWGAPYLIGRLYFSDLAGLRELAIGIFIGGLIYIPLCVYEMRMSPVLHFQVFGYHQHYWSGARLGGYRPSVFMQNGLALGMWMTTASLMGIWLWTSGALGRLWGMGLGWTASALLLTTLLCRSLGAIVLLFAALGALFCTRLIRTRAVLAVLVVAPVLYVTVRTLGVWRGEPVVSLIATYVDAERANSLQIRLDQEEMLIDKAMQQPLFGWAGWGRNRVFDEWGNDISLTDGLWVIALGQYGLFGLGALLAWQVLPGALLVLRMPADQWARPPGAAAGVISAALMIWALDNLMNAMINPIYIASAGGLLGLAASRGRAWGLPRSRFAARRASRTPPKGLKTAPRQVDNVRSEPIERIGIASADAERTGAA